MISLKELYKFVAPFQGKKGILRSITITMANGVPVKVVFVQNSKQEKRLAWHP